MELPISLLIQLLLTACVGLNFIGKITDLSFGIENGSVATVLYKVNSRHHFKRIVNISRLTRLNSTPLVHR